MVDLKCKRVGCLYNENCNCCANEIKVSDKANCTTFKDSNENKGPVEDIISQSLVRNNVTVECKAPCVFNSGESCSANGITVCTEHDCVCCSSFMPE